MYEARTTGYTKAGGNRILNTRGQSVLAARLTLCDPHRKALSEMRLCRVRCSLGRQQAAPLDPGKSSVEVAVL